MEGKGGWPFKLPKNIPKGLLKKDRLLILLLSGILLVVIAWPVGSGKDKEKQEAEDGAQDIVKITADDRNEYTDYMEKHLKNMLSQMEGVGEATVMITLKSSAEKVVEKDVQSAHETVTETDSQGGERTTGSENSQESTVYDGGSGSSQTPYVSKEIAPEVEGVVVLASGGDNAVVVRNITEAVQALFGIDTHKIKIMKKN